MTTFQDRCILKAYKTTDGLVVGVPEPLVDIGTEIAPFKSKIISF